MNQLSDIFNVSVLQRLRTSSNVRRFHSATSRQAFAQAKPTFAHISLLSKLKRLTPIISLRPREHFPSVW